MEIVSRLRLAQRIVIVVGLGLVLAVLGEFTAMLGGPPAQFGWIGYAPLTAVGANYDLSPWQQMLVWMGLITTWASASVWLLRPTRTQPPESRNS